MIDIHSHILPGVDDGAKTPEESVSILKAMKAQGVTKVIATPHFYSHKDTWESFLERRQAAFEKIPYDPEQMPEILLGAEVTYFDRMIHSEGLKQLQLGDSKLLLLEMPFRDWTDQMVQEVCDLSMYAGVTPVLAHIDRYREKQQLPKYLKYLRKSDVLFQCGTDPFLQPASLRWAMKMFRKGNVHFLGSDAHNLTARPPQMDKAAQVITEKLGEAAMDQINTFSYELFG